MWISGWIKIPGGTRFQGVPCFLFGCWGGVSLLPLIKVGGSRPGVPLFPLSSLFICRAVEPVSAA